MPDLIRCILAAIFIAAALPARADSASLLAQAQASNPARYAFVVEKNAEIRNTPDNKAFTIWWQPSATTQPTGVIVNLHGHASYATDAFYLLHPYAEQRGLAILSVQWWFGGGEATSDYYEPQAMYPIIASLLAEKGVKQGAVLLHGFSRGSTNTYAVTALDAVSGNHFIGMTLSNAGGATTDYPPNQAIAAGTYGALPFERVRWMMYCGELDPEPNRDGCPAMTAARTWVTQYGATVSLFIDDPTGDHGGFMINGANATAAFDAFSAFLASTPPTSDYQGLWWNPNESGWGMSITKHGSLIFAAIYAFDQSGEPTWYVMSSCPLPATSCTGTIYKVSGGSMPTARWNGTGVQVSSAGTGTLSFSDASNGQFSFTIDGVAGVKSIVKNQFATGATAPAINYTDIWWNADESGWGIALTHQYGSIFAAWYAYDNSGKAIWYVASNCVVSGDACSGDLYQVTGGSRLTSPWNGAGKQVSKVGTLSLAFSNADSASMNYSINGIAASRLISRLRF